MLRSAFRVAYEAHRAWELSIPHYADDDPEHSVDPLFSAEGLDDVIEGTRHVRGARLGKQGEQAAEQAEGGADLAAIGSLFRGRSEEAAEQLIGVVYQVDLHLPHSVGLHPQREFVRDVVAHRGSAV